MSEQSNQLAPFDSSTIERNRENGFMDLDEAKKAFCIVYVTNGYKHREAAEEAGLNPDKGIQLKREPLVSAYIYDLQQQYLAESIVTKQVMDAKLDELEDIAMGRVEIPLVTGAGDKIEAKKFMPDMAMKVYSEKVRLHKIVEDKSKSGHVSVSINMAGMVGNDLPPIDVEVSKDE